MPGDTLTLGEFAFELDDFPEEIPLGGEQQMQVIKYPGGYREIQVFGVQRDSIGWSGVLNYTNAVDKMNQLSEMFKSGKVYVLQVGSLPSLNVIITKFKPKYRSPYEIPYDIELEIAPTASLLIPTGSGSGGTTSTTAAAAPTKPDAIAPSPQKTYIVRSGDTLWKIAARFYKDGSQYRRIAAANSIIKDPNKIQVGWKLVIPS